MKRILIVVCLALSAVSLWAEIYKVTSNTLNVRSAASTSSKVIGSLQKGLEIDVTGIENGFACFDFLGIKGYASIKYLEKVAPEVEVPVKETPKPAPVQVQEPVTPPGDAIVYIFYDVKNYIKSMPVTINGDVTFGMEGEETVGKMTGTRYKPSKRKLNVHGEGRMFISIDFTFADKPFHSDLTLDITDGGVYYVKMYIDNMWNAITKKRNGIYLKQLTPKEGMKELEKDKYTVNPDVEIIL